MGLQRLNQKKVRKLSEQFGIEFVKVATWGDVSHVEGVDAEDNHYSILRKEGTIRKILVPMHWSSCPNSWSNRQRGQDENLG